MDGRTHTCPLSATDTCPVIRQAVRARERYTVCATLAFNVMCEFTKPRARHNTTHTNETQPSGTHKPTPRTETRAQPAHENIFQAAGRLRALGGEVRENAGGVAGGGPFGGGPVGESLEALEAAEASASIGGDNRSGEALRPVLCLLVDPRNVCAGRKGCPTKCQLGP